PTVTPSPVPGEGAGGRGTVRRCIDFRIRLLALEHDEAEAATAQDGFGAALRAVRGGDGIDVIIDGVGAGLKLRTDGLTRESVRHQAQDLDFAGGEFSAGGSSTAPPLGSRDDARAGSSVTSPASRALRAYSRRRGSPSRSRR